MAPFFQGIRGRCTKGFEPCDILGSDGVFQFECSFVCSRIVSMSGRKKSLVLYIRL